MQGSSCSLVLLGLPAFRVLAEMDRDGEVWLLVETGRDRAGCPACGLVAVGHGRRMVQVRDLPSGGRPVRLVWRKRLWRCPEAACGVTWSETTGEIAARAVLTARARRWCVDQVAGGRTVAAVARDLGVGWHTVMAAVRSLGGPLVDDPGRVGPVAALGVDEHRMLSARPGASTVFVTGFVDLHRGRLLDLVPGRSGRVVRDWLDRQPVAWRAGIDSVALDPHRGYANGLTAAVSHAVRVVDHFHAIKLANQVVTEVRCRVQQQVLGHRGRKGDPLYGVRRLATRGWERLSEQQYTKVFAALAVGDPDGEVGAAIMGKELLREVYRASDRRGARRALFEFYTHAAEADVAELSRLARTIEAWEAEVLAYHHQRLSNGPTEAVNLLIEKHRRAAHGYRNFDNYRLRMLLTLGIKWQTQPTARIRQRKPRSIA